MELSQTGLKPVTGNWEKTKWQLWEIKKVRDVTRNWSEMAAGRLESVFLSCKVANGHMDMVSNFSEKKQKKKVQLN